MNNTAVISKLCTLVNEHPDYPIIARIDGDVVSEIFTEKLFGKIDDAYIGDFLDYSNVNGKYYDDESEFMNDYLYEERYDSDFVKLDEKESEEHLEDMCEKQNWKRVIYVNICPIID